MKTSDVMYSSNPVEGTKENHLYRNIKIGIICPISIGHDHSGTAPSLPCGGIARTSPDLFGGGRRASGPAH